MSPPVIDTKAWGERTGERIPGLVDKIAPVREGDEPASSETSIVEPSETKYPRKSDFIDRKSDFIDRNNDLSDR
jgi:hypothetical protein